MSAKNDPKPANGRRAAAAVFAAIALCALAVSGYYGRQRWLQEHPPPLPNVIAPIPPEQLKMIRAGFPIVRKTVLHTSADQDAKLDQLWEKPPRSLAEVIQYERRTNEILTTQQLVLYRPIRQSFQNRVIDKMLAPSKERLPPQDYDKLQEEVKKRVRERIEVK